MKQKTILLLFKKKKRIQTDIYNSYEVIEKNTGISYLAYISSEHLTDLTLQDLIEYSTELNIHHRLNHPCIIKLKGYSPVSFKNKPKPLFMTEFPANNTLYQLLEDERKGNSFESWNDTKKLINIYGIASAMSYLHSMNIMHGDLNPRIIYLDEFLFPKIGFFIYSKDLKISPENTIGNGVLTGTPICMAPEVINYKKVKLSDVFSFSIVVYMILLNQFPYDFPPSLSKLNKAVTSGIKPKINKVIPECYKQLMEKCWQTEINQRPSFEEIVYQLKTDPRFITEAVNKEEFFEYIDFIDKSVKQEILKNPTFNKVKLQFRKKEKASPKLHFSINMETVNLKKFHKESQIGKGGFGKVYKIIDKENDDIYAAKVSIYELNQCTDDMIVNLSREVEIISNLNHPSIMKFIGYSPNNFKFKQKPTILTEFCSYGSLDKIIEKERMYCGIADWNDTKKLINIYGIAEGMRYLHSKNYIHRDLKPANILLDEFLYPKIADFGLSKEEDSNINDNIGQTRSGFKGTYLYSAPEILSDENYTRAGDVYAYAMIVYEIITNDIPFQGLNQFQLIQQILNQKRPTFKYPIPYCYRKLINKCWLQNEHARPSFSDITTLIEKDPSFITENIDKEEFLNYVSLVKESKSNLIVQSNSNNTESKSFNKISVNLNHIQSKDIVNENNFLNLNKFEKIKVISKDGFSKVYKIKEKYTGSFYAAKISINLIDKFSNDEENKLIKEIDIISQLYSPSFLKFIGFSPIDFKNELHPVIITEYLSNGTLNQILESIRNNEPIVGWNNTKKLIVIYGIASGMSYLHSHEIIHKELNTRNVWLNEYLFPKIGDFGLSSRFTELNNLTFQSTAGFKAIPSYYAPEVLRSNLYSKSSDVYAFSFIVYEIIADKIPFENLSSNQLFNQVVNLKKRPELDRPVFKEQIPIHYRSLFEKCWAQEPSERPTFDEIVHYLRTEKGLLLDTINQNDYFDYVDFIDESRKVFESTRKILIFDEFIKNKRKIKEE